MSKEQPTKLTSDLTSVSLNKNKTFYRLKIKNKLRLDNQFES